MYDQKKNPKEEVKLIYAQTKVKGIFTTSGKYGHGPQQCWHNKESNIPKFHYYNKLLYIQKECQMKIQD